MSITLNSKLDEIPGIGPAYIHKLQKLGIETVRDFLLYLPRRWDDYSHIVPIREIRPDEIVTIKGKIWEISNKRARSGINITEAIIADDTGTVKATWFNQPFLIKSLKTGDEICLAGKLEWNHNSVGMVSPAFEKISDEDESGLTHVGRIVPVYAETEGITSKWLRSKIKPLMKLIYSIRDYLPEEIKREQKLIDLPAAIRQMHFPENALQLKKARERLDFDEMFLLQLAVLNSRKKLNQERAIALPFNEDLIKGFVHDLPYQLTNAQRKAAWEILQDLARMQPMNRLLQGDVGSGKTVVAAIAMLNTAISNNQAVLLCPTEILVKQHFTLVSKLLKPFDIDCVMLVGSTPKAEKEEIYSKIREGEARVIIGTHALLEKGVEFWRLGLAIVDEQHRFGVDQRAALRKESLSTKTLPHFLTMTATPIPRTLSLTLFGDLDLSILDELPPGRKSIITRIVPSTKRQDGYHFIEEEIKKGRQAFVVCPLIGDVTDLESEKKSVMVEYQSLSKNIYPDLKIAYIHGKMKSEEKEKIMSDFAAGETNVLVSTSVIEVGIDVPNSTIMIIEDADRFGLSQLHQFRGRVGRGEHQSYCFLFTKSNSEPVLKRLNALVQTNDGFKLSEVDLEIRGPGDFIGARQHGLPDIKMKNLMDLALIKKCRDAANNFLAKNNLEHQTLLYDKTKVFDAILYLE
ncbi:MAG: ATP-dependent DNA helicase RecG [Patescibacteria group bacterium]